MTRTGSGDTPEDLIDTSSEIKAAVTEAKQAAEEAEDSAEEAEDSAEEAEDSAEEADSAALKARSERAHLHDELLIHETEDETDEGLGQLGPAFHRGHPFRFGFFAGLGALLAYGLVQAMGKAQSVLVLLVVSMFIAVGLNPLVEWFIKRGVKRSLAVGIVFLLLILAFTGVGVAIVPVVTDQVNSIIKNAPGWLDLLTKSKTLHDLDDRYHYIQKAQDYIANPDFGKKAFGGILGATKVVANALFSAFTVLILTLYFLASLPAVKRATYSLVPASRRRRVSRLGDEILRGVGNYVSGQFMVALIAGVCAFVFLEIVGLRDYAVALAIVVMVTDFIPMVGSLIGIAIISLVGFADGIWIGVACVAYGIVYQQVENYVVYPRIMRRAVDIPGAVTVIAALLGGALLGVVGALLAIPTAAAILLIIREVWVRRADAS
ncbi:MAG TPA: AI-2E family transporter [Kribbellaceae bacterium]|nr:AI-2E family transporter [Kribbellaceae bacterium]